MSSLSTNWQKFQMSVGFRFSTLADPYISGMVSSFSLFNANLQRPLLSNPKRRTKPMLDSKRILVTVTNNNLVILAAQSEKSKINNGEIRDRHLRQDCVPKG